jgi:hypothetical protein
LSITRVYFNWLDEKENGHAENDKKGDDGLENEADQDETEELDRDSVASIDFEEGPESIDEPKKIVSLIKNKFSSKIIHHKPIFF